MILQARLEGAAKIQVGKRAEGKSFDFKNKLMPKCLQRNLLN